MNPTLTPWLVASTLALFVTPGEAQRAVQPKSPQERAQRLFGAGRRAAGGPGVGIEIGDGCQLAAVDSAGVPAGLFGASVAIAGSMAAVGNPEGDADALTPEGGGVYMYTRSDGGTPGYDGDDAWTVALEVLPETPMPGDRFGTTVALNKNAMLVSRPGANGESGGVQQFMFAIPGDPLSVVDMGALEMADFVPADLRHFGSAIAMDGTLAVVGAENADNGRGAVYAYRNLGAGYVETQRIVPDDYAPGDLHIRGFGASLAIEGNTLLVGAPRSEFGRGRVVVFEAQPGGTWLMVDELTSPPQLRKRDLSFGGSIDMSSNRVVIGAPGYGYYRTAPAGAAFVYHRAGVAIAFDELLAPVNPVSPVVHELVGSAVAVDGNRIVLGAPGVPGDRGSVYSYDLAPEGWGVDASLDLSNVVGEGERFGFALDLEGGELLVGAPHDGAGDVTFWSVDQPTCSLAGGVVITEFLKDPTFVSDATGEFVELYNTTMQSIDIEGWVLSNGNGGVSTLDNQGAGIELSPGTYFVVGASADPILNGGVGVDQEWGPNFTLPNGSGQVVLTDDTGVEIDRVEYDGGAAWPNGAGQSLALAPSSLNIIANDEPNQWSLSTCPIAGSPCNPDTGTPGAPNGTCSTTPCPVPTGSGELIFTEIMAGSLSAPDASSAWIEVYNTTAGPIDLAGYRIAVGASCQEIIAASVVVAPGSYALIATNPDPLLNGGLPTPDWVLSPACLVGGGTGPLAILDPALQPVAILDYGPGTGILSPDGTSIALSPLHLSLSGMSLESNWCTSTAPFGFGDLGTPGGTNGPCR